jgi:hypothetical protein
MRSALAAIWDFVVGDDWVTAAGVVIAGAATAALQSAGVTAWWLIPVAAVGLLTRSVARHRASD